MSTAVRFALSDFVTGSPIIDLPIMAGASWATLLNRPDSLSCTIDMRDRVARTLDLPSTSEPKKTVLSARTEDDVVLAWGVVSSRKWNEDSRTLSLEASGFWQWLNKVIIGPATARASAIVNPDGSANTALDTSLTGWSLGTIGKKLVAQRLGWPGSPALSMPADQVGARERAYPFVNLKSVGAALTDLTKVDNGPDFAFDAARAANGLNLNYFMRHGSEAQPRIGTDVGTWSLGPRTPLVGFEVDDDGADFATAAWMTAGRQASTLLAARALNDQLVNPVGYPSTDIVDTSHGDVTLQSTLDAYNAENLSYAAGALRSVTFSVRGSANPGIGAFRPGDTVTVGVPSNHLYLRNDIALRVTGVSGNETGEEVKVQSVVLNG